MSGQELDARAAIANTIAAYTRFGDAGRVDDFVACFVADGVLETAGRSDAGAEAIAGFVRAIGARFASAPNFLPARHHVASIWIDVTSANEAQAGAYFTLMAADGADHWGAYRDRLVRVGDQWKFAHRRVRLEGARPGSPVADMVE